MTLLGVLAFVVALTLSVALHEAGHLLTAKHYGMKASAYFIGFGPRVFSFRRGETEYGLKAIPAGGYVKIIGMTALEETDPADADRLFYRQPAAQRSIVLVAGSAVHLLIAVVLFFGINLVAGVPSATAPVVGVVATTCLPRTNPAAACAPGDPASPAAHVGFRPGDRVLALDGRSVSSWAQFAAAVRAHGAGPVSVLIRRGAQTLTLRPDLVSVLRNPRTGGPGTTPVGAIGLGQALEIVHPGPLGAARHTGADLEAELAGTGHALAHFGSEIAGLFSPHRSATGFVGVVGIARISGQTFAVHGVPLSQKIAAFLSIIAGLNLFVGLFNLLPLLPLDGGHLGIIAFETVRSRLARLLRRPDPGRVDVARLLPLTYGVVAVFIALTLLIVSADIVNPVNLPQ